MTVQTGTPKLDQALSGGIAEGSSVMVLSAPVIDSMDLLNQITYENLQKEKNCFIYIDDCPPDEFVRKLSEKTDWDLNRFSDLHYIDGFSAKTGIKSKEKYIVDDSNSINDVSKTIDKAIRRIPTKVATRKGILVKAINVSMAIRASLKKLYFDWPP